MSRNQRIGLLLVALAVAVVAIVVAVASGSGDDDEGGQAAQTTQETTRTGSTGETDTGTDTTEEPHETVPAAPVTRIRIQGGQVAGGPADIKVTKGDTVRIVVSADAPDDIHLHGYDIEKPVKPGRPARFNFKANIEGIFEIESHVAEDAGRDPLVGKLTVEPN